MFACSYEDIARDRAQDDAFLSLVKTRLKKVGDTVKVSVLFPGDWQYVCAMSSDSMGDIRVNIIFKAKNDQGVDLRMDDITSTNKSSRSSFSVSSSTSIMYFMHDHKTVTIYETAFPNAEFEGGGGCVEREYAYLEVIGDEETNRYYPENIELPNDFIRVKIASEQE